MKELANKIILKVKKFINFFSYKLKNSKSFLYTIVLLGVVIGYGFFFNSNAILRDDGVEYTTPLFEIKKVENSNIELRGRKYCKSSNMVELYVYSDDTSSIYNNALDFDLREKSNPGENIKVDIRRIDKNNYVVRAEVPKKWSVLSLGVTSFDPLKIDDENNKSSMNNTVKFYTEHDDIDKVNNLDMKNSNEYIYEFADLEIESIKKKIVELNKLKQDKNKKIDSYNENIARLNEDKAYQTDSEIESTNTKISSIESIIKSSQEEIDKLNSNEKELKDKIKKLDEKKRSINK